MSTQFQETLALALADLRLHPDSAHTAKTAQTIVSATEALLESILGANEQHDLPLGSPERLAISARNALRDEAHRALHEALSSNNGLVEPQGTLPKEPQC